MLITTPRRNKGECGAAPAEAAAAPHYAGRNNNGGPFKAAVLAEDACANKGVREAPFRRGDSLENSGDFGR